MAPRIGYLSFDVAHAKIRANLPTEKFTTAEEKNILIVEQIRH